MTEVFVSYSHIDRAVADSICAILESLHIEFFRDEKSIDWGESIGTEVRLALEESEAVLVIISPASLKSYWVPYEIGYAAALGKRLLPFLTHPSLDVPAYIRDLKFLHDHDDVTDYFSTRFNQDKNVVPDATTIARDMTASSRFRKIADLIPGLLAEMKQDVQSDNTHLIREFVILPIRGVVFQSSKPRFTYFESEHENLLGKIDLLEEYGFIRDVAVGDTPIYRMTPEFMQELFESDLAL